MHKLLKNNLSKLLQSRRYSSVTFATLLLGACGSGGSKSNSSSSEKPGSSPFEKSGSSSSEIGLTNDPFIDGLTFGTKFEGGSINFAVSGGMNGEYWLDPQSVLDYFQDIVFNTVKFTNINATSVGSFSSPVDALKEGSDVTLVPYVINEFGIPYGALGFAFPIGMEKIPEFSGFPIFYSGQEADIFINFGGVLNDINLSFQPGAEGYLMVLHELGHALGLKHPHDTINSRLSFGKYNTSQYDLDEYTIMSYNDDSHSYVAYDPITPMVLDVIALQYLYGKNMEINSGNTDHRIVHTGEYYSIWDPSGLDTINLSNSKWDWYVELPYVISSSIHGEYVGVAFTDENYDAPTDLIWLIGEIENIVGGSGNDVLVGNHLNNHIDGGSGNDIIYSMGASNILIGGLGRDHFTISSGGSQNVIKDFNLAEDTWSIMDRDANDVSYLSYTTSNNLNGHLEYKWTDSTSLVFEGLKNTPNQQSSFLFEEDDNSEPSDYDYVRLDTQKGQFTIHLDNYNYFELLHEDISDGSSRLQFSTYYSDIPSEDPEFVSPGFGGYNWENADSITVEHGSGLQKSITVTAESLKTISLDTEYDYIGFLVSSDNYWAGDEFLIADVTI